MVNIKTMSVSQDGGVKKISVMWDEINDDGRILGTNNRITRAVTDPEILECINKIELYLKTVIEED